MLSASFQQARHIETGDPKWYGRAGCSRGSLYILDRGNQKYPAVIPCRKPFRVLNIPFAAIANLHSGSHAVSILNEDGIRLTVDVIASPVGFEGEPLAIG